MWPIRRLGSKRNAAVWFNDNGDTVLNLIGMACHQNDIGSAAFILPYRDAVMLHKRLGAAIAARRKAR